MKKISSIVGIIILLTIIYLIYVYIKNNGWNKIEDAIFVTVLVIGLINSITMVIKKKPFSE
jgi:hypothetical protein